MRIKLNQTPSKKKSTNLSWKKVTKLRNNDRVNFKTFKFEKEKVKTNKDTA